ncbi:MAG: hypothetical protein ACD_76C00085G0011 [uncultured bacterium]|nr:MAG: hypothetical protein ACD_76C00085G0011 [uncultured bacterium]HBD05532.1 hypothetical protein [Candidatus Uhrbacteria bacterium]
MGELNFNTKQCIRALKRLGFYIGNKRSGRHDKFYPSKEIADLLTGVQPRFIMIPRHRDLHCQSEIVSELRKMGGDSLVEKFNENL